MLLGFLVVDKLIYGQQSKNVLSEHFVCYLDYYPKYKITQAYSFLELQQGEINFVKGRLLIICWRSNRFIVGFNIFIGDERFVDCYVSSIPRTFFLFRVKRMSLVLYGLEVIYGTLGEHLNMLGSIVNNIVRFVYNVCRRDSVFGFEKQFLGSI